MPRAACLCGDSRPGLGSGPPERREPWSGGALRAPSSPQSGLKSIFHSTAPKSPRAPTPFRPPWARWGGGGEGGGGAAAPCTPCSPSRPGQPAAEPRHTRLRGKSLPSPRRAPAPLSQPPRLFLVLCPGLSLRFPSQAVCPRPCLAAPPSTLHPDFSFISPPSDFAPASVLGKGEAPPRGDLRGPQRQGREGAEPGRDTAPGDFRFI